MCSRTSCATNRMKCTTCCGSPANRRAQLRVLGGDPHRARVEVADPHHHAAQRDERRGREPELLGAEQRADHDVAAGLELPVDLHRDARPQVVHQQHLVGLGQPELPGDPGVLDRGQRRRARASVVAADQHHVGVRLGHPRRDRPHPHLGHQLDRDPGVVVGVLQVVDELREVLDRVDVVVRRRADEADARRRVADPRDPRVDLVARQLAALAGLGALGHLDLQLAGVDQVLAGDAEAAGGDLLDRAVARVAVGQRAVALRVLAALAGVRLAAQPVHGDRQRLVGLPGDGAVAHGPGLEASHDRLDRLDLLEGDRPVRRAQVHQAAQRAQARGTGRRRAASTP